MSAKDGQPAQSDSESNYEAAVLDFLDREMAGTQSALTEKKQSEELDALVADLLHQVIAESDQTQSSGEMMVSSEDMKDLLAEFVPPQETYSHPAPVAAPPEPVSVQAERMPFDEAFFGHEAVEPSVPESPEVQKPEIEASTHHAPALFSSTIARKKKAPLNFAAALFASPLVQKNRKPLMAAAAVCLLAAIGIAIYSSSGLPEKVQLAETTQAAMPAAVAPAATDRSAQVSAQPAARTAVPKVVPSVVDRKAAAANSKTPVPAATVQKPPDSQIVTPPPAPMANTVNPIPSTVEKSAEPQVQQSAPPVMPQAAPEKPAPSVVTEKTAPAGVSAEIKPAQQTPVIAANVNNASPAPPLPATATAPVVHRNPIPAVAISQVSPKFPEFALRTRTSASVVLELEVDKQGKVVKATPVSGPEMFHKEAINAAMQWRYRPASIGGNNVSSQVKVTFNFNLKNR